MGRQSQWRMVLHDMRAPGRGDATQPLLVRKCTENGACERSGFARVKNGVLALDERTMPLDRRIVDDRHGTAGQRFVVPEAIPPIALGRPDQPGGRTPGIELARAQALLGRIDPDPGFGKARKLACADFPDPGRTLDTSGKKDVGGFFRLVAGSRRDQCPTADRARQAAAFRSISPSAFPCETDTSASGSGRFSGKPAIDRSEARA